MYKPMIRKFAAPVIAFVLGVCVAMLSHTLVGRVFHTASNHTERMRVTSPDGKLDAVLVQESSGGALGGILWSVYVVPRGKSAPNDPAKRLFFADELTRASILWSRPFLIEIHYDKASIMHFRNISTEYENGVEYAELRLVPTSEYSLMTPDGRWRPDN
jgi:hypothetical protein